jgi:hypothetical protein
MLLRLVCMAPTCAGAASWSRSTSTRSTLYEDQHVKLQLRISEVATVQAEAAELADLFDQVAALSEIFGGPRECGMCGRIDTVFTHRTDKDGNHYRQVTCRLCHAEKSFGLRKGGGGHIFPRLKDGDGNVLPNGGWYHWQKQEQKKEAAK